LADLCPALLWRLRTKEMEGHERDEKGRRIENGGEEGKRSDGPVVLTTAAHLCRFF